MVLSTLMHDGVRMVRSNVPTGERLLERVGPWLEGEPLSWRLERVYFDTEPEPLPLRAHLRATRREGFADGEYVLSHRTAMDRPTRRVPHPVTLAEVPEQAARWFGVRDARPQFRVSYQCERHVVGPVLLTLLSDVRYAALTHGPDVPLGIEQSARAELTLLDGRRPKDLPKGLREALAEVPAMPQQSMQWMGMHQMRRMFTAPTVNDLPGFEYEVTLSARDAEIDLGALPFPVLEIGQTGSVRGYYKGFRAGVRDGVATITKKGDPEIIDGVCKRPEEKHEVSAWTLDPKRMQMYRYKRSINVINPATSRVYTICLHWCVSSDEMYQVEVEYQGIVPSGSPEGMRRFRDSGNPSDLADVARILEAHDPRESAEMWRRVAALSGGDAHALERAAHAAVQPSRVAWSRAAEKQVVDDLGVIRDGLIARHGLRPTTTTKRKWLQRMAKKR